MNFPRFTVIPAAGLAILAAVLTNAPARDLDLAAQAHPVPVSTGDPFIWTDTDRYWGIVRIDGHPVITETGVRFAPTNSSCDCLIQLSPRTRPP